MALRSSHGPHLRGEGEADGFLKEPFGPGKGDMGLQKNLIAFQRGPSNGYMAISSLSLPKHSGATSRQGCRESSDADFSCILGRFLAF